MSKFNFPLVGTFVGLLALLIAGFIFLPSILNNHAEGATIADNLTPTVAPSPEPTLSEYEAALEHALNFDGTRNDDWTPYVYTGFTGEVPMVLVPAGCFLMGSTQEQLDYAFTLGAPSWIEEAEAPAERICLDAFWIDQAEVPQADFVRLGGEKANPNDYIGNDLPVINITWFEAYEYCQQQGKRLPTEAEWEYAARGLDSLIFPWGNDLDNNRVNYCDENCPLDWRNTAGDDGYANVAPVGSYDNSASWVGAWDMSGNVWEWLNTSYGLDTNGNYSFVDSGEILYTYPYRNDEREDYSESPANARVLRSGSWGVPTNLLRSSYRSFGFPTDYTNYTGFRCARDIEN